MKNQCSNCGRDSEELGGVVCRECSGLDEVQEELAALKRKLDDLRAAAERYFENSTADQRENDTFSAAIEMSR